MQAPIYVSKQIVLTDAIKLNYGMGRVRNTKSTYDVLLDRYYVIIRWHFCHHQFCILVTMTVVLYHPLFPFFFFLAWFHYWAWYMFIYSPVDGPDLLAQELSMMQNMHIAAKLERFEDAGIIMRRRYFMLFSEYSSLLICCVVINKSPKG